MKNSHFTIPYFWLLFVTAVLSKQDTDEIWQILTQKQKDFCKDFKHLCSEAKQALEEIIEKGLKIALIGNSSVDKSTLVNALTNCAYDSNTCDYAKSCGSDECTNKAESFRHPTIPSVDYVDLPAVGTANFPWEKNIGSNCSIFNVISNTYSTYCHTFSNCPKVNYYQYGIWSPTMQ
jgi:ATPase subunit of ABC transporter with duplicated ATPase domains